MKCFVVLMFARLAFARVELINDAIGDFNIRLLKRIVGENGGNLVYSPYSISTALGMCLLGSREKTYTNIRDVLGLGAVDRSDIEHGFRTSITDSSLFARPGGKGFVLSGANRLYVNESLRLSKGYVQDMRNIFQASAESVDFKNNGPAVRDVINAFVSEQTRKLIPEILADPLPNTTVMTLINALYSKGTWKEGIGERPSDKRFNAYENGSNQAAKWLGLTKHILYAESETLNAQLVEVPYTSRQASPAQASMVFILPDDSLKLRLGDWLRGRKFTWANVAAAMRSMEGSYVDLTFPEFRLESELLLQEALWDLGMKEPFTLRANFSDMVDGAFPDLHLDEVIHKAKMHVDEYGTKAAAATVSIYSVQLTCAPPLKLPLELRIDRSFVAMIILREEESIVPLFTAVVDRL